MRKPVLIAPPAQAELRDVAAQYEALAPELGRRFLSEFRALILEIETNPHLFVRVESEVRRAPMRAFPFGAFYVEYESYLELLAVLDLRRDPLRRARKLRDRTAGHNEEDDADEDG